MKVYTDYGKKRFKALGSCLIVIEDSNEWSSLALGIRDRIKSLEKLVEEREKLGLGNPSTELGLVKLLADLRKLSNQLEPDKTIPLEQFDIKKLPTGLHKK